jgi:hypothetical protein
MFETTNQTVQLIDRLVRTSSERALRTSERPSLSLPKAVKFDVINNEQVYKTVDECYHLAVKICTTLDQLWDTLSPHQIRSNGIFDDSATLQKLLRETLRAFSCPPPAPQSHPATVTPPVHQNYMEEEKTLRTLLRQSEEEVRVLRNTINTMTLNAHHDHYTVEEVDDEERLSFKLLQSHIQHLRKGKFFILLSILVSIQYHLVSSPLSPCSLGTRNKRQ